MSIGMGACLPPRQAGVHWMGRQCHPQSPDICYGSPPVFWGAGHQQTLCFSAPDELWPRATCWGSIRPAVHRGITRVGLPAASTCGQVKSQ